MSESDDKGNGKETISRKIKRRPGAGVRPGGQQIDRSSESRREPPPLTEVRRIRRPASSGAAPSPSTEASEPSRRRPIAPQRASPRSFRAGSGSAGDGSRRNRLVEEASALIALGGYLLGTERPQDLNQLRKEIVHAISHYRIAIEDHYGDNTVRSASFCLCAYLDDCVLRTFWGRESEWARQSVLAEVHQTAHRRDLIKQIEEDLDAAPDPALFALYHTVLSLGFEAMEGDEQRLLRLREGVYREVRRASPDTVTSLVDDSFVSADMAQPLSRRLPAWSVLAIAGLVITALFWAFQQLQRPQIEQFESASIKLSDSQRSLQVQDFFPDVEPVPAPPSPDLYELLAEQIERREVELFAGDPGTRIVLNSDEMFASGSANFKPSVQPLLTQVAAALEQTTGPIRVEGHTDNVPFRSALATNQSLSTQRSEQVAAVFVGLVSDSSRLRARGYADREPLECNDSAPARARNRRVEILLPDVTTEGVPTLPSPDCVEP